MCLGRTSRSIQACRLCAPFRADCGPLHATKARRAGGRPSIFGVRLWCDLLAASSDAQLAAAREARAGARLRPLSLGVGAAREFVARAPRRAGCGRRRPYRRALHRRKACLLRRVAVVQCVSCQRAAGCRDAACETSAGMRGCTRCVLGGRAAAFKLFARANPSALVVVISVPTKARRTGGGPAIFDVRLWCDVPAASSDAQLAAACEARAEAQLCPLSLGRWRSTRVCARAPRRVYCGQRRTYRRTLHRRKACLLRRAAVVWCASCQRVAGCRFAVCEASAGMRHCARCVLGGGAVFKLVTRARPSVLVVVISDPTKARRTGGGLVSFGELQWCGVPAANAQPVAALPCVKQARACATALDMSWEDESQHSSLSHVCALLCWLWSSPTLQKRAGPAEALSSSVCDCGATC